MYEVVSAARWAFIRAFNTGSGPDTIATNAVEYTIPSRTLELDLATVSGATTIFAVKQLWLKLTSDSTFIPMVAADRGDHVFRFADNRLAADTTVASGHPAYYDIFNVTKARFSPALPTGAILRLDFWGWAVDPNTSTNNTLDNGADIASPLHQPVLDKATAQVFRILDDDRARAYELEAERKLVDALHTLGRIGTPTRTKPFRFRRGRRI